MRKTEKQGYTRGVPKALDDGIEIARWSTKGGAHWLSLRERLHPTLGAYWDYTGDGMGGGYTQMEGYDRQRAFASVLHRVERAAAISGINMTLEFNLADVDQDQALASMARHSDPLVIMAQWRGLPANFFAARVEEVARAAHEDEERIDAMKCAGLKANILYLIRQFESPAALQAAIEAVERTPSVTQADSSAHQLIAKLREEAADFAFQSYDFGDAVVEAADGWESVTSTYPGRSFSRKVYIEAEDGDGPTETVSFSVNFEGASVIPSEVSALLMSNGQEIGFMPVAGEPSAPGLG